MKDLEKLQGSFWTRLNELVEDIESEGFEVLEANNEYLVATVTEDDEDVQYEIKLSGERTIVIEGIEEIYRG